MGLLDDELRPGVRRNAFYPKTGVLTAGSPEEEAEDRKGKSLVNVWDKKQQKHVEQLVDAEEYYSESNFL